MTIIQLFRKEVRILDATALKHSFVNWNNLPRLGLSSRRVALFRSSDDSVD